MSVVFPRQICDIIFIKFSHNHAYKYNIQYHYNGRKMLQETAIPSLIPSRIVKIKEKYIHSITEILCSIQCPRKKRKTSKSDITQERPDAGSGTIKRETNEDSFAGEGGEQEANLFTPQLIIQRARSNLLGRILRAGRIDWRALSPCYSGYSWSMACANFVFVLVEWEGTDFSAGVYFSMEIYSSKTEQIIMKFMTIKLQVECIQVWSAGRITRGNIFLCRSNAV